MRLMTMLWWAAIPLSCSAPEGPHSGGSRHESAGGFRSFYGQAPPELVSAPSHWVNANDAVTLRKGTLALK